MAVQATPAGLSAFGLLCILAAALTGDVKGYGLEFTAPQTMLARFWVAGLGFAAIAVAARSQWWPTLTTAFRARVTGSPTNLQPPTEWRPFIGRREDLDKLARELQIGSRVCITGLGGVGKTRLAAEFVREHTSSYGGGVFWLRGESIPLLEADFASVAEHSNQRHEPSADKERLIKSAQTWLQHKSDVLLVIDNLEPEVATPLNHLAAGLPCQILATSRYPWWGKSIPLAPMVPDDARRLLEEGADHHDEAVASQIVEELGRLPIAVEQAASYIRETGQSLDGFLQLLKSDSPRLLAWKPADPDVRAVGATWAISIKRIENRLPGAIALLRVCAFLPPDEIPIRNFTAPPKELPEPLRSTVSDQLTLDSAIRALLSYSMVERVPLSGDPGGDCLKVHRLVQQVIRDSLSRRQRRKWTRVAYLVAPDSVAISVQRSTTAVLALIVGVLSIAFCLPGPVAVWLGARALREIARSRGTLKGVGFAWAGIGVAIIGMAVGFLVLLAVAASPSSS